MIRAHKIRLHPTEEQKAYFAKAAGIARFCWNWALAEWNQQSEAGEKPTALKLKKQFNCPWHMRGYRWREPGTAEKETRSSADINDQFTKSVLYRQENTGFAIEHVNSLGLLL